MGCRGRGEAPKRYIDEERKAMAEEHGRLVKSGEAMKAGNYYAMEFLPRESK